MYGVGYASYSWVEMQPGDVCDCIRGCMCGLGHRGVHDLGYSCGYDQARDMYMCLGMRRITCLAASVAGGYVGLYDMRYACMTWATRGTRAVGAVRRRLCVRDLGYACGLRMCRRCYDLGSCGLNVSVF
jgi:hypothetical protein